MSFYFILQDKFQNFIGEISHQLTVIAPQLSSKQPIQQSLLNKNQEFFSFEILKHIKDLRLDYDTTILPPKKVFFTPQQVLLSFKEGHFKAELNPKKMVLFGVHLDDLLAIEQTDFLFRENYEDIHYTAQRNATTIIGSNFQTVAPGAFWNSMNEKQPSKHDGFLTKLKEGYVYQVLTEKAQNLLQYGQFEKASKEQIVLAKEVNEQIKSKLNKQLDYKEKEIKQALEKSYADLPFWDHLAKSCYACGSCNLVCPSCYCFNIEDHWHADQTSGARTRFWDSCMTEDFAKISLGGGKSENFRDSPGSRMRHRMMRKMVYLNDKLGSRACVGCGRCSTACTANIADPVDIINQVMEKYHD